MQRCVAMSILAINRCPMFNEQMDTFEGIESCSIMKWTGIFPIQDLQSISTNLDEDEQRLHQLVHRVQAIAEHGRNGFSSLHDGVPCGLKEKSYDNKDLSTRSLTVMIAFRDISTMRDEITNHILTVDRIQLNNCV